MWMRKLVKYSMLKIRPATFREGAVRLRGKPIDTVSFRALARLIAVCVPLTVASLAEPGQGGRLAEDGVTALGGDLPVNTSGGLKARGNPPGATGIAQVVEIYGQLKGRAEGRQVPDARVGLAHNVGGTGATVTVHVLEVA